MTGLDTQIEKKRLETRMSYIDIVTEFAEENIVDYEDLIKELHPSIVDKLKVEFVEKNMVRGQKNFTSISKFMEE